MQVKRLLASSDSQLVVSQVNGKFVAKDSGLAVYLKLVLNLVPQFERFELVEVPRLENTHVDALSKLASSRDSELLKIVLIERLPKPSISGDEEVLWIEGTPLWMQPIVAYLNDQSLLASKIQAKKLRRRAAHFILQDDMIYKRGFASPLLRCVGGEETIYILREIYEGVCGNHSGGTALAHKVFRQGHGRLSNGTSTLLAQSQRGEEALFLPSLPLTTSPNGFGIPHSLEFNNGRQFDNKKMRNLCDKLSIRKYFSTPHHSQANGQVEAVNKTIKHIP
ncbi:uncharacterized protein LOC111388815 [Olea europaea var. sylvestris]|uniref:uncharacterized protein LOC111388815 n=1 Tax=Olea europaea var. sylvestris TaxID=158386 RepID=UPI000C1D149B|nr:uncharacterized protein LOC111388815 [Olea europaea var. sylvestris]